MEKIFVSVVKKLGLDTRASLKTMPVIIQSFDEATIRRVATEPAGHPPRLPDVAGRRRHDARLKSCRSSRTAWRPEKVVIARHPGMVKASHALGMTVTSWTFKQDDPKMAFRRCATKCSISYTIWDRRALHQQPGSVS
jgi:glycerophosphoryl diester phosphodiesterase